MENKGKEAADIKKEIIERFRQYLKDGVLDFTNNLSAQIDLFSASQNEELLHAVESFELMAKEFKSKNEELIKENEGLKKSKTDFQKLSTKKNKQWKTKIKKR